MTGEPTTFVIHVCPDCSEQIDGTEYDPEVGTVRGHYHDPPEGWWTDDGDCPGSRAGSDPWFDAIEVRAVPLNAVIDFLWASNSKVAAAKVSAQFGPAETREQQ